MSKKKDGDLGGLWQTYLDERDTPGKWSYEVRQQWLNLKPQPTLEEMKKRYNKAVFNLSKS
jgi:hypothetical protein